MSPGASPGGSGVKNPPTNARDMGSTPESGLFPIEGNGNTLQLPGERCLAGYIQYMVSQRVRHSLMTKQLQCSQADFEQFLSQTCNESLLWGNLVPFSEKL